MCVWRVGGGAKAVWGCCLLRSLITALFTYRLFHHDRSRRRLTTPLRFLPPSRGGSPAGTTGNPKGVLYSHRSTVLHSFVVTAKDGIALGEADDLLVVVPLFHANAWGIPYASAMAGSRLVFPGPFLDGPNVYKMLSEERISLTFGVPYDRPMRFDFVWL